MGYPTLRLRRRLFHGQAPLWSGFFLADDVDVALCLGSERDAELRDGAGPPSDEQASKSERKRDASELRTEKESKGARVYLAVVV